jgi:hypothetical protein
LQPLFERKAMGENNRGQETSLVTSKFGFLAAMCTSPIFIVSAYLGDPERGTTAWFSAMMVLIVIRLFSGLRKRVWFWITITIVTLLHVLLISSFPGHSNISPLSLSCP